MPEEIRYDAPNKFAPTPFYDRSGDTSIVQGYQNFEVSEKHLLISNNDSSLKLKKDLISFILDSSWLIDKSVADLGSNFGYFALASLNKGATSATAVDIDENYLRILNSIKSENRYDRLIVQNKLVSEFDVRNDLVFAFALIHWIYSCTELYGSLSEAVGKLSELTDSVLVIEWVDPKDKAIKEFKHLDFNKGIHQQNYTKENFEAALKEHFEVFEVVGDISETRTVYVAYKKAITKQEIYNSPANFTLSDIFISLSEAGLDYTCLRNEEIIHSLEDHYGDRQVDVLVAHRHREILEDYLLLVAQRSSQDEFGNSYLIDLGESNHIILRIIDSESELISIDYAKRLMSNKHYAYGIKSLSLNEKINYLLFHTLYHLGGAENAYDIYLRKICQENNISLPVSRTTAFEEIRTYLDEVGFLGLSIYKNLAEYSIPYLEDWANRNEDGDDITLYYSRILDFNNEKPYISRIYFKEQQDGHKSVIKQGNHELIESEHESLKKLSNLESRINKYFPKTFGLDKQEKYCTVELEFF
ncbi:MAG: hypothetical protein Kapaf2KO_00530 [Candidatus Kapaibacteriales bacterium]